MESAFSDTAVNDEITNKKKLAVAAERYLLS
jgi:hypothetical protein